jgi:uncharacterized protein YndB with AHSA1/START domain
MFGNNSLSSLSLSVSVTASCAFKNLRSGSKLGLYLAGERRNGAPAALKKRERKMATKNKPNEIYIERIYDAPVKMVWDAWVDPQQVVQWWGPRGFTVTNHSKDVRTGGHWNYTMHGPDGVDYPNTTKYLEVEEYSQMVYDHGGNADQPPMFRVTAKFIDLKGKTRMEMTMALATVEAATEAKKFIKKAGGNSTWDRLAEYLEMDSTKQDIFVINQTFDAPINLMFEVWTHPKHLSQWTGPAGSEINYLKADIKPGGSAFYCMTGQGDAKIYGKANYLEMTKPHRLIYTQTFCDENEKITRHPMAPTWPEVMKTTVLFAEEDAHKTRVTLKWEVMGDATPAERETFSKAKAGMSQGWGGSFDKLEDYLVQVV